MQKTLNIQFFSMPGEFNDIILNWVSEFTLRMVIISMHDEKFIITKNDELADESVNNCIVVLSLGTIDTGAANYNIFRERNPDCLYIDIGFYNAGELHESWLHSLKILQDKSSYSLWLKLSNRLRKNLISGGYAVLLSTNEKKFSRNIKYSASVRAAALNGLRLFSGKSKTIEYVLL